MAAAQEDVSKAKVKKPAFFISPIGAVGSDIRRRSDQVLKHILKKALDGHIVVRADEEEAPDSITPRMIKRLQESDLLIVDISGNNPNVFYEMALGHGYRKPMIYLAEGEVAPPFDVKDLRVIPYDLTDPDNLDAARELVAKYAKHIAENPDDQHNPVADADAFFALRTATTPGSEASVFGNALEVLSDDMSRIRHELARMRDESRLASRPRSRSLAQAIDRLFTVAPDHIREELGSMFRDYEAEEGPSKLAIGEVLTNRLNTYVDSAPEPDRTFINEAIRFLRIDKAKGGIDA